MIALGQQSMETCLFLFPICNFWLKVMKFLDKNQEKSFQPHCTRSRYTKLHLLILLIWRNYNFCFISKLCFHTLILDCLNSGVPKLNRPELEAACEDFSNIIGSFSDGTVYKGTLSSGVEIAVTSSAVTSPEDWSKNLEAQFRKKV